MFNEMHGDHFIKIGTEIVLKNATQKQVNHNLGENGNTDIDGIVLYEPGAMVPVILDSVGVCGCYAKIISVTITEVKTHVVFEFVQVSNDIAESAYKIYCMTNGKSIVGSHRANTNGKSRYSLDDNDDPRLDSFRAWTDR